MYSRSCVPLNVPHYQASRCNVCVKFKFSTFDTPKVPTRLIFLPKDNCVENLNIFTFSKGDNKHNNKKHINYCKINTFIAPFRI
jgi:hypothetical protein